MQGGVQDDDPISLFLAISTIVSKIFISFQSIRSVTLKPSEIYGFSQENSIEEYSSFHTLFRSLAEPIYVDLFHAKAAKHLKLAQNFISASSQ